jgi:hypothetical protein
VPIQSLQAHLALTPNLERPEANESAFDIFQWSRTGRLRPARRELASGLERSDKGKSEAGSRAELVASGQSHHCPEKDA